MSQVFCSCGHEHEYKIVPVSAPAGRGFAVGINKECCIPECLCRGFQESGTVIMPEEAFRNFEKNPHSRTGRPRPKLGSVVDPPSIYEASDLMQDLLSGIRETAKMSPLNETLDPGWIDRYMIGWTMKVELFQEKVRKSQAKP